MKVFIVSDCELLRVAFTVILKQAAGIDVVGQCELQSSNLETQVAQSGCDVVLLSARASLSLTLAILKDLKESNPQLLVYFMETALDIETARTMPFDGFVSITDNNKQIVESLQRLYHHRLQQFSPSAGYNSMQIGSSG